MATERQAVVSINFKPGNTTQVAQEIRNELAKPPIGGWLPGLEDKLRNARQQVGEVKPRMVIGGEGRPIGPFEAAIDRYKPEMAARAVSTAKANEPTIVTPSPVEPVLEASQPSTQQANPSTQQANPSQTPPPIPAARPEAASNRIVFGGHDGSSAGAFGPAHSLAPPVVGNDEFRKEMEKSFSLLSSSARHFAIMFDSLTLAGNKKTFESYKEKREEIVSPDPAKRKKPEDDGGGVGGLLRGVGSISPLGAIGGLVGMVGMGGVVASASQDAIGTLTGSFRLLSGQIGMAFIPAVSRVSGMLQRAADVVDSVPIGVREFVGTTIVAAGAVSFFTIAVNKASASLAATSASLGIGAGAVGIGTLLRQLAPWMFAGYLAYDFGAGRGNRNWAPGRNPFVHTTVKAAKYGSLGAGIGAATGAAIGMFFGNPLLGAFLGTKAAVVMGLGGAAYGAGVGYGESGAPPKDKIKLANSFQSEFIANPSAYYDKILMQAVSGDAINRSMEELQMQGNDYLRQTTGYLAKMSGDTDAANRIARIEPA